MARWVIESRLAYRMKMKTAWIARAAVLLTSYCYNNFPAKNTVAPDEIQALLRNLLFLRCRASDIGSFSSDTPFALVASLLLALLLLPAFLDARIADSLFFSESTRSSASCCSRSSLC